MKRYQTLFIFIIFALFISGCTEPVNEENSESNPYLHIINKLTSKEMEGRLTGTEGNQKAVDFIKEQFISADLEPVFKQSYLHTYNHTYFDPDKLTFKLAIHFENDELKLDYAKDYLELNSIRSLQVKLPICPFQEELINVTCIFITKEDFPMNNSYVKAVLLSKPTFSKSIPVNIEGLPFHYQISEEVYERLLEDFNNKKKIEIEIEMNMKLVNEVIEAENVVGKITGKGQGDQKDALIISAHFDSLGSIGDSHIEGAIDNATGVASLIQLANKLNQHSLSNEFQTDIIFVAFNGEESYLQGSKAFVEDIGKSYKNITNINIDSIGNKGLNEYLVISTENGEDLREQLVGYLKEHQFTILEEKPSFISDHVSFARKHYPAVTIGQPRQDFMHTINDKKDNVDVDKLEEIVTGLFNYIVDTE